MKMKKSIGLLLLLITTIIVKAQTPLTVDAGKDTSYCFHGYDTSNGYDTVNINCKTIGGVPPYSYNWEMYSKTTGKKNTILADSNINTVQNPRIIMNKSSLDLNDIFVFKVKITDNNKNTFSDSCTITISKYIIHIDLSGQSCNKIFSQDSIEIYPCGISGGIPPYTNYNWFPKYGLSNPYISNPKASLNGYSFINYSCTYLDNAGCVIMGGYVLTDIKNGDLKTSYVSYKNPVSSSGTMNFTSELIGSNIRISSVTGTVLYQTKIEEPSIPLGSIIKTPGIYYYTVATTQGNVISGSFIKE